MDHTNLTIVFMGSPEFAVPTLRALDAHYKIAGVVTQPDRPAGRGRTLTPPPIKVLALELGLPIIQPNRMREPGVQETLQSWAPDLIVVAAFGQILRANVLELPRFGCINVHASLLPRWRGAAPVHAAIRSGDIQTGVTIMRMDAGVDTGPILCQRETAILVKETTSSLTERLAIMGAELLFDTLPGYLNGEIIPSPQDESLASYAPMLQKADGELDFNHTADELERQVRAFQPWPGTYISLREGPLKVLSSTAVRTVRDHSGESGQRVIYLGQPAVWTAEGLLVLDELQPPGKKPMSGKVFLQGARDWV